MLAPHSDPPGSFGEHLQSNCMLPFESLCGKWSAARTLERARRWTFLQGGATVQERTSRFKNGFHAAITFVVPYKEAYSWRQNSLGGWKQYLVCSCFHSAWKVYRIPKERGFLIFFFKDKTERFSLEWAIRRLPTNPDADALSFPLNSSSQKLLGDRLRGKNTPLFHFFFTTEISQRRWCLMNQPRGRRCRATCARVIPQVLRDGRMRGTRLRGADRNLHHALKNG